MKAQKVWFPNHNVGDPLAGVYGLLLPGPTPWYPAVPPSIMSAFWVEVDTQGTPRLCTFKTNQDTPLSAQFIDPLVGVAPYTVFAKSFSAVMDEDSEIVWKPQ